jgi:hypothetical protein
MGESDRFLTEREFMVRYNLSEAHLRRLRDEGLPFIDLTGTIRLYEQESVAEFFLARKTVQEARPRRARRNVA